ncbi:SUMF1/EgtB/PvdO family nonheme iron enzyme, partial [Treponema sp. R6D11]
IATGVTTGFIVTFESNGGTSVPSQNVADGGFATRPANPTKSNYIFDYWYKDTAFTSPYYFNTHVTANITLYAKWVANSDNEYTTGPGTGNINVIWIPGGTYLMGSPASEKGHKNSEVPQHEITLSGFYMGKYEITQDQYRAVMGSNPSEFSDSGNWNRPVERLTWIDAIKFCNQLSYKEGLEQVYNIAGSDVTADFSKNGYRLPTEAEWEYACRAETTTAFNNGNNDYNNTASVSEVAWFGYNSSNWTHDIGKKKPNAWKLYDMHGNVFEWCWDAYDENYYSKSISAINPTGPNNSDSKVVRGGSWENPDYSLLRSAARTGYFWNYSSHDIGFRVVRHK